MRGCRCLQSYFLHGIKSDVNDKDVKMLKQMKIKRFTVFQEAVLDFSPQLNVIVGENGTGKSHLLKLAYSLIAVSAAAGKKSPDSKPSKTFLQKAYGEKLSNVFRPETLGRLATRKQGRERCEVELTFDDDNFNASISFATNAKTDAQVDKLPLSWDEQSPLYLPARELITIYPNFVSIYSNNYLEYDEAWFDTCIHLGALLKKAIGQNSASKLIKIIEKELGGEVVLDKNGRFYLYNPGRVFMEIPLIAEGHRKLAMLARLIANGIIQENSYVFFDEPEANLNPKLIKLIAKVIHELAMQGVQIFIATHSLFLLRELEILSGTSDNIRYFGLQSTENGVTVLQGNSIYDIGDIAALEESLQQSDRYLAMDN